MRSREIAGRVQVHRQTLVEVQQLDEKFGARAVPLHMVGPQPRPRVRAHLLGERFAIGQHGETGGRLTETGCGRANPFLGAPRAAGSVPKGSYAVTAAIEVIELVHR